MTTHTARKVREHIQIGSLPGSGKTSRQAHVTGEARARQESPR